MLPKTVFFYSPAANHACSIRALGASVIRLVGWQTHYHHHRHDSVWVPRLAWQQQERSLASMQTYRKALQPGTSLGMPGSFQQGPSPAVHVCIYFVLMSAASTVQI